MTVDATTDTLMLCQNFGCSAFQCMSAGQLHTCISSTSRSLLVPMSGRPPHSMSRSRFRGGEAPAPARSFSLLLRAMARYRRIPHALHSSCSPARRQVGVLVSPHCAHTCSQRLASQPAETWLFLSNKNPPRGCPRTGALICWIASTLQVLLCPRCEQHGMLTASHKTGLPQLRTWPLERGAHSPNGRFAGGSISPELERLRKGAPLGTKP